MRNKDRSWRLLTVLWSTHELYTQPWLQFLLVEGKDLVLLSENKRMKESWWKQGQREVFSQCTETPWHSLPSWLPLNCWNPHKGPTNAEFVWEITEKPLDPLYRALSSFLCSRKLWDSSIGGNILPVLMWIVLIFFLI